MAQIEGYLDKKVIILYGKVTYLLSDYYGRGYKISKIGVRQYADDFFQKSLERAARRSRALDLKGRRRSAR